MMAKQHSEIEEEASNDEDDDEDDNKLLMKIKNLADEVLTEVS